MRRCGDVQRRRPSSFPGDDVVRVWRLDAEPPDVICLDLMMPDVDGFEVLRRLKADPATHDIPVVVVTSKPLEEHERRALLQLASGILSKEFISREDAVNAVDRAMGGAARTE